MPVRKGVIPAAGWGTRFLPATKAQPKEMLPLVDKPIIQYVVEEAVASGVEDILIITGLGKRAIEDHFDRHWELERHLARRNEELLTSIRRLGSLADIHFIRQKEYLGLGHAIYQARRHVGSEPFAVLLGDEIFLGEPPCLKQLIDVQAETGGSVIAALPVPPAELHRYGVIDPEPLGERLARALDLVEKPPAGLAPSNLAISGRYILDPAIFAVLEELPPGCSGEIQLTDGLRLLNQFSPVFAYEPTTQRYDVGEKLGYIQATIEMALARPDLAAGLQAYLRQLNGRQQSLATTGD